MKAFAVINVARQINGDMVFVKIEKAFLSSSAAAEYITPFEKATTEMIQNSNGFSVECSCIKSVCEIEIEEK